ncbi:hypothetical protein BJY04DRAFT_82176 [Aspergillus karnatakaensis]|uniref:uncharacterized protein n=1 Tax=Aspergillus karnatakaensis TaxID=1810916 RepID=UPI003CCD66A7
MSTQYHQIGSPAQPASQPTPSSWRFLAPVSSHFALVGFLVIPLAFGGEDKSASVNRTATVVAASVMIGIAYSLSLFLVLSHFEERTFVIHSILVPGLMSNILALFNVMINVICRNILPMSLLEILSLSFAAAFAFLYALGALWLYARDVNEAIGVESNRGTILLTDEEMQRQQLQRLLEQSSSRKSLTPRAVQKTYQVNHPDRLTSFHPQQQEDGYFS